MATRYGYQLYQWLLERGWRKDPESVPEDHIGDPMVWDPQGGQVVGLYKAAIRHFRRTGEMPQFLEKEQPMKDWAEGYEPEGGWQG